MTDQIRKIVEAERRRTSAAAARLPRLLEQARAEARALADRFAREEPSLKRVILFGSVATGRVRSERFDIDLAVDADRLGSILCAAEESRFRVDLADLRSMSESFRRLVLEKGTVLYDARTEEYATLAQELSFAWQHIEGQYEKNRRATERVSAGGGNDDLAWAALGYTIHNLYNAVENYFLRVAKFFENRLDEPNWHKDLVDRMVLAIEGVRPSLLPPSMRRDVHELRSFRHVFRNIYDTELDPVRVEQVNRLVAPVVEGLREAHLQYLQRLREIRAAL